jgi:hypothetical protein
MKHIIKLITPELVLDFFRAKRRAKNKAIQSAKEIFTAYKDTNFWKSSESVSGDGSELSVTKFLRIGLEQLIASLEIKTILDIPCGDFNWMKAVNLDGVNYLGGDIVGSLIESNEGSNARANVSFKELDLLSDSLPAVDLIFCRDCLVHLSYNDIYKALLNIKRSKSKYLLATSFVNAKINKDILTGEWRKLNLELQPFKLGKPLKTIDENYTTKGEKYSDKMMCLWSIEDIKIPFRLKLYAMFF